MRGDFHPFKICQKTFQALARDRIRLQSVRHDESRIEFLHADALFRIIGAVRRREPEYGIVVLPDVQHFVAQQIQFLRFPVQDERSHISPAFFLERVCRAVSPDKLLRVYIVPRFEAVFQKADKEARVIIPLYLAIQQFAQRLHRHAVLDCRIELQVALLDQLVERQQGRLGRRIAKIAPGVQGIRVIPLVVPLRGDAALLVVDIGVAPLRAHIRSAAVLLRNAGRHLRDIRT